MTTRQPTPVSLPRVLLVCPVGGEMGGAEQVMLALGRELPRYGFDPVLAAMRPGKLTEVARSQGIEAYAFAEDHRYRDFGSIWRGAGWLTKLTQSTGAQLLHATHTAHLYAWLASRRTKVPEVWHVHDLPASERDSVSALNGYLLPLHTLFTTQRVAEAYPRLRRHPFSIIPPSCVESEAIRARERRPDVRARLGLPCGPLLLTVTRLQEHKGHSTLLEAAAAVLRARPDAVFGVVGAARTTEQEAYRSGLLVEAQRLGIGPRFRLLGFVDDEDLAELYRAAEALVHPSWSEGYGLVLLEAMGMGLPVIAAAATGPAEILQNEENGLLVPVRDAQALVAAIVRVLGEMDLRDRLRAAGLQTAARLTLHAMVASTAELYREVITAAGRASR